MPGPAGRERPDAGKDAGVPSVWKLLRHPLTERGSVMGSRSAAWDDGVFGMPPVGEQTTGR